MKKLAAITVLGLALGFSNPSFASDYMGLYKKDSTVENVSGEVRGGGIETNPMSFYVSPVISETDSEIITKATQNDENAFLVFGIRI
jgi:hypothetical protein